MIKSFTTLLSLLFIISLFGQTSKNVEDQQLTVNFLLPGVVYEAAIAANSTITAEATMGFAYQESDFFGDGFGIYPIGRLQYRYYYNFERRLEKGKNISGNTGNYIAPMIAAQSGKAIIGNLDLNSDFFVGIAAVYGLQRTAPKGFQFRLEIGPGYFFDEFDSGLAVFGAIKLGWVIRKKR